MAAPLMVEELEEPEMSFPWLPPYTVDTLFELPDTNGLRFEVLGGSLVVSPQPTPRHNGAAERLARMLGGLLPLDVEPLQNTAIRMPDGDGPVPDLLITSADLDEHPKGLPAALVHTVVEVVSPSNAPTDRITKTELYANVGIPCYWRIEQRAWKEHFGPVPAIVVRLRGDDGEWTQTIAPAGLVSALPVVIDEAGTIVTVKIDPAILVGRRTV